MSWSIVIPAMVVWLALGLIAMRLQPRMGDVILMVGHNSPIRLWLYFWIAIMLWPTFGLALIPIAYVDQWLLDRDVWGWFRGLYKRWFGSKSVVVAPLPAPSSNYTFANRSSFPPVGEKGFLYTDLETMEFYQWTGTRYAQITFTYPTSIEGLSIPVGYEAAMPGSHIFDNDISASYPHIATPSQPEIGKHT